MNLFQKFEKAVFGRILGEDGWVQFIPLAIEGIKAIASAFETGKGESNVPTNQSEFDELTRKAEYLNSEKKKIENANGWFWSSAGDLQTINNKIKQNESAMNLYRDKIAADTAHTAEVTAAKENIETQKTRGLQTLEENRQSRGLKGAGEVYNPDKVLLENVASANAALERGENVYNIQQQYNKDLTTNQESLVEGQQIKKSNEQLLGLGLNLAGTVAGQFGAGGLWGTQGESDKALDAITNQNKLLISTLAGKGQLTNNQVLQYGYGPLNNTNSILDWTSKNTKNKNWWELGK